jgi:hypothetical protein
MACKVDVAAVLKAADDRKRANTEGGPLKITVDGDDVIFDFNSEKMIEWKGCLTSEMACDHGGRKLLMWLLDKDFNQEALEIIARQLQDS